MALLKKEKERKRYTTFVHVFSGMFDRDQSGQIDINEFQALWNYIQQWRGVFDGFDRDRSGAIDVNELHNGKIGFHSLEIES